MAKPQNIQEYLTKYRAAVAQNPECGTSHYNLAVGLLGARLYDEAEREFILAIENSPSLAEAYVQLGGICLQRGDLEGCLSWNKRAVNARAGFAEGYGNIGFVNLQLGKLEEAVFALRKAIKWNPKFLQARANLANAYLMQGEVDDSISENKTVLEQEPLFSIAHNNLAIAYMEKGEHALAKEHLQKAIELGYEVSPELRKEIEAL